MAVARRVIVDGRAKFGLVEKAGRGQGRQPAARKAWRHLDDDTDDLGEDEHGAARSALPVRRHLRRRGHVEPAILRPVGTLVSSPTHRDRHASLVVASADIRETLAFPRRAGRGITSGQVSPVVDLLGKSEFNNGSIQFQSAGPDDLVATDLLPLASRFSGITPVMPAQFEVGSRFHILGKQYVASCQDAVLGDGITGADISSILTRFRGDENLNQEVPEIGVHGSVRPFLGSNELLSGA